MIVGLPAAPTAWNPLVASISIFERPLLKPGAAGPKRSCLDCPASLEAAMSATSATSPFAGDAALIVKLICGFADGQLPVPPFAIETVPGVDDPEIIQLEPLY